RSGSRRGQPRRHPRRRRYGRVCPWVRGLRRSPKPSKHPRAQRRQPAPGRDQAARGCQALAEGGVVMARAKKKAAPLVAAPTPAAPVAFVADSATVGLPETEALGTFDPWPSDMAKATTTDMLVKAVSPHGDELLVSGIELVADELEIIHTAL